MAVEFFGNRSPKSRNCETVVYVILSERRTGKRSRWIAPTNFSHDWTLYWEIMKCLGYRNMYSKKGWT